MSEGIRARVERALAGAVRSQFGVEPAQIVSERPPRTELGDLAFPVAFELARSLKRAPRKIAEELKDPLSRVEGVSRVDVAGAGYLNVFFDRALYLESFLAPAERKASRAKIIVEHTNINPNKAAHIGHLRNAALGDSFVRTLRFDGGNVEVQNYIDDTGVQVADVVVGFLHLENKSQAEVEAIAASERFDYHCWDLYARVSEFYQGDRERLKLREKTLKAIEEGEAPEGPLGAFIAEKIVRCHLATMDRIDVRYDLLPWESDILRLKFWQRAYELLKERKAIRLATSGKNQGCWVMDLGEGEEREAGVDIDPGDEKVIVRSNGTVTYVGKDIAYQMWKLGLLDRQFGFRPFHRYPDGATVWSTAAESTPGAPDFGKGERVYNVIDVRQSYLQNVVQRGVALLASEDARERSHHFSYEMVALTPATCRELGFPVSPEEEKKPYLEVSGRRGLGVKADDLLDALEEKAGLEVAKRNPELDSDRQKELASAIARGALRYFMIKFTKNKVIAFDFSEALSFEGDSGPYVQYAAVRAAKILQKLGRAPDAEVATVALPENLRGHLASLAPEEAEDFWSLVLGASDLEDIASTVVRTEEPAHLARHALTQAQAFNAFYHRYRVQGEPDEGRRALRFLAVEIFYRQQLKALSLMGIPVPERM
jgi:arginyl-tRNA synthetase